MFLLLINYVKDQELQAGEKMSNAFTENQKMLYGALNEKQKKSTVLIIKDKGRNLFTKENEVMEKWSEYLQSLESEP